MAFAECPPLAMSGSKRCNRAPSAEGQEADIAVPALDPHSWRVRKTLVFRMPRQAAGAGTGVYGRAEGGMGERVTAYSSLTGSPRRILPPLSTVA